MTSLETCRRFYADEIRAVADLQSAALVDALTSVPRERFLGPGPWEVAVSDRRRPGAVIYRKTPDASPHHVYHNVLVAIDSARQLNNGHPGTLAACLDVLRIRQGERFLHVGCGTGYYTALAAAMVGRAGRVVGLEIDADLAARARENMRDASQVTILATDGTTYAKDRFDAVLVNAGFTHPLPNWLDSLDDGGRLLLPITSAMPASPVGNGFMLLVTRDGVFYRAEPSLGMSIFSSPTGRHDEANSAIRQAFATGQWFRVRSVRRDAHSKTGTCCIHVDGVCISEEEPDRHG